MLIQRNPLYHLRTTGFQSTILTILAFTVFLLPTDCNEKINLGVALLLGLTMTQLGVHEMLPETGYGNRPLLGTYLTMNFVVVAMILFCTLLSKAVYFQPGPVKNRLLRTGFLKLLPAVLLVRTDVDCKSPSTDSESGKSLLGLFHIS